MEIYFGEPQPGCFSPEKIAAQQLFSYKTLAPWLYETLDYKFMD